MLFSSLTFLFIFLPILIIIYFIAKDKYKNYILLAASLLFYSWGEPKYILLMILSIIINYYIALLINKSSNDKVRKIMLLFSVVLNIGLLFGFKYLNFFITNINNIGNISIPLLNISLPIGISFYSFQILSYVVDVYKKDVKVQRNIFLLGTYISFFPQLIAGPIVRYSTIEQQLAHRKHSLEGVCNGIRRFIVGLGKKVIIANNAAIIADNIFNSNILNQYGLLILIIGALSYTIQIYYDFSGYSDMAIGLGKIFGFTFLENFNYPYISTSITDFWHRWHISLSTWFRDYVYIPLGGNRCSKLKWIRNIIIVWLLTGFWHGASWNYIIWGLYYAIILLLEKLLIGKYIEKLPKIIQWLYAFILINIGWIIFRLENIEQLKIVFINIFTFKSSNIIDYLLKNYNIFNSFIFVIIGLIFMFPILKQIRLKKYINVYSLLRDTGLIIILLLSIGALINNTYNPFIYFRF